MRVSSTIKTNHINFGNWCKLYKAGDIIKGEIIEKDGHRITIKITSQNIIDALIQSDIDVQKGSLIEIMITNITEGKIYARILTQNSNRGIHTNTNNILSNLGIDQTEENLKILEAFIKYNQLLDKDAIEYTKCLLKIIESFKEETADKALKLLFCQNDIMNTPLYQLNSILESTDTDIDFLKNIFPKEINNTDGYNNSIENITDTITKLFSFSGNICDKLKQLANETVLAMNVMKDVDLETLMFFMSKNIEINLRNILIYKLINEKNSIISYNMEYLIKDLEIKNDTQSIISTLKKCYLKPEELNRENIKSRISELIKILPKIEYYLSKYEDFEFNKKHSVLNIKETIKFIDSLNQYFNYLYIPMDLNGNKRDVEILIFEKNRRNKKIDASNSNILICLNMPNIGYIESFIEIKNNKLNIMFKSENEWVAEIIKVCSSRLKEMLYDKGYKNISITSVHKTEKKSDFSNLNDIINPKVLNEYYRVDVRI